ncbi:MAG: hypothetical protein L0H42_03510 [Yaniella sp.]|uniref:hypothetical protein n=1 Tax=Yaniella sp. TaxID=2773929 RepID=UPI0026494EF9|nr:hypothetical protein [Yaniella sp.]MDN5741931.1 hypothetical protein [Yaniella sp.]MDN5817382.1 hypothetical protein [Yaniella sp.]
MRSPCARENPLPDTSPDGLGAAAVAFRRGDDVEQFFLGHRVSSRSSEHPEMD